MFSTSRSQGCIARAGTWTRVCPALIATSLVVITCLWCLSISLGSGVVTYASYYTNRGRFCAAQNRGRVGPGCPPFGNFLCLALDCPGGRGRVAHPLWVFKGCG